jgi:Fe-S-cluster containining protein
MKKFRCERCGSCCKQIGNLLANRDAGNVKDRAIIEFPYHAINGTCEKYKEGKGCTVYYKRPLLCNVRKYYEAFYSNKMSMEDFYKINKKACKQLATGNR